MKKNVVRYWILSFVIFFNAMAFSQTIMPVNERNFSDLGWHKGQTNIDASKKQTTKLETDLVYIDCSEESSIAKLRRGSVYMSFPKNTDDPHFSTPTKDGTLFRCLLFNDNYDGVRLQDIVELKYSTYTVRTPLNTTPVNGAPVHPVVAPVLILQIAMKADGTDINNISFVPFMQRTFTGSGYVSSMQLNTWQEWDALDSVKSKWIFFSRPGGGNYKDDMASFTFKQFWTRHPDARIINNSFDSLNGGDGVRFMVGFHPKGFYDDFRGYVDAFRINTKAFVSPNDPSGDILYDFDGECKRIIRLPHWTPPWPPFWDPLLIFSVIGVVMIGYWRRFRKKKANT